MWASCLKVRNMKSENAFDQYTVVFFILWLTGEKRVKSVHGESKKKKEENCELQQEVIEV